MYPTYHHHHRTEKRGSYFLPFLSIIIIGLIIVLVFQIVEYFQAKRSQALENKAAVNVAAGRAEMKILGVEQWMSAVDGSILQDGDAIKTLPGSRVVLSLLNGGVVRLSSDTEVELTSLKTRKGQDELALLLKKGEVWLKRSENEVIYTSFYVRTPNFDVTSLGTVFDVENSSRQSVHVLDGKVKVDLQVQDPESENAGRTTVETMEVALGQEISLGSSEISDLNNRKPLDLLAVLSDNFRNSDWYKWNIQQDASAEPVLSVEEAVLLQTQQQAQLTETQPEAEETPPEEVVSVLQPPELGSPAQKDITTKTGTVTLSGKVNKNAAKVKVTTYISGKAESYFLQKYQSGSGVWSYVASWQYNNLFPGENRYTITAVSKTGVESEPLEVNIFYDKPKEPADMSAPKVISFNGVSADGAFETDTDEVLIEGQIGKGIQRVFVNDFMLTRYVIDSAKWAYSAKTIYGNFKEGENIYSVYGEDVDGNKTPVVKFTIIKKPTPVEEILPASESSENPPAPPADNPAPVSEPVL